MRRRVTLAAVLAALLMMPLARVAVASPMHYPVPIEDGFPDPGPPEVTAATWILYDETSDAVLAAFAPDTERAIASTTKIMTALLALENSNLDDVVTISQRAADTGEREIGLVADEQVELSALLKAALIHSGNDAATAIAEHVGGSVEGFVDMMNERAVELGLDNTHFANPHGLDAPGHYSSARDMLRLAREAMKHPVFRDIVRSRIVVFPPAPDGTPRIGTTTDLLLADYEGASGIKTGFTNQALLTFVASAERNGRRLYAVVLGSEGVRAHMSDARLLFDYGFGDLAIYGALAGGRYTPKWPRSDPGPIEMAADMETLVHVAASGLVASPPVSLATAPEPVEPPATVVSRSADRDSGTVEYALRFWVDLLAGDG